MLGAEGKADFLVSMAGPGIKGDSLLVEQQNALFKLKGIPSNVSVSTLRKSMATQPGNVWLEYFMDYDPRPDLERITIRLWLSTEVMICRFFQTVISVLSGTVFSGRTAKILSRHIPD